MVEVGQGGGIDRGGTVGPWPVFAQHCVPVRLLDKISMHAHTLVLSP